MGMTPTARRRVAVTAIGDDRPGIVAAVTGALADLAVNLEDTSMTRLEGQFAMVLVTGLPDGVDRADIEHALAEPAARLGLTVSVRTIGPVAEPDPSTPWSLTVHGADRPGIVHRIATVLAGHGVNIVDLETRVLGDPDAPAYAMLLELALPEGVDADGLGDDLRSAGAAVGVSCSLRPVETDIF